MAGARATTRAAPGPMMGLVATTVVVLLARQGAAVEGSPGRGAVLGLSDPDPAWIAGPNPTRLVPVGGLQQLVLQELLAEPYPNPMSQVPVVGQHFEVNPISTAMKCVINLTVQYMLIYTALALCRTAADSWGMDYRKLPVEKILANAALTVNYAPMLAVLFLGVRMRVLFLSKGRENPPEWMQLCMYMCTYSLLLLTLTVCVIPLFTGQAIDVDERTGDIPLDHQPFESKCMSMAFTVLKYTIMLFLYVGAVAIVAGTVAYKPPAGTWPEGEVPEGSPAVNCVMILSCQFFIIYALVQLARSYTQVTGSEMTKFESVMLAATNTVNFAPMLAILFIAARMRALQMDPVHGAPQPWAQKWFYACTCSLLVQTVLSVAVPLVLQGKAKRGSSEGDMEYEVQHKTLGAVLVVARYVIMFCTYVGFSLVIYSIFTLQHPNGPRYTPAISVTLQCVVNLTVQFFFVYLMIWICITIKEFTGKEYPLMMNTMENAKATISFCPMLAILFVGTRMRALYLTNNQGAPQGWAQDGMFMATWAVLIQFVMVCANAVVTGAPTTAKDVHGHVVWKPKHKCAFLLVQFVRWMGFCLLYGGVITVVVAVFTMTPQNANGRGSVPLVGDGRVPGMNVHVPGYRGIEEPVGPNDIR